MGKRFQARSKAVLPVRVSGVDAAGREFTVFGHTLDFHSAGARLGKVQAQIKCGDELTVQYRNNKARFVVRWIGPPETAVQGQLGLECLEGGKDLWPLEAQVKSTVIDDFQIPQRLDETSAARDKRYPCKGVVEVRPSRSQKGFSAKIADISAEGCRVLVPAALPIGTTISLLVRVNGTEIEGTGVVRTAFPGEGMGIFFTHFASPADKHRLMMLVSGLQSAQITGDSAMRRTGRVSE